MNKAELLETLRTERARWDALLAQVDEARLTLPGAVGEAWSVKDLSVHISWSERETVGMLRARALVGSGLWELPQDERNEVVFQENRARSLDDVRSEGRQVFAQLLDAVASLSDEDLADPGRFAGMPAEWLPWKVIASNSYEHYRQHIPDLDAWLKRGEATS